MDLNEYIKINQLNPNPALLSQLGASQELIEYLRYTPENTNFNVLSSIGGGSGKAEVWLVGNNGTEQSGMKIFLLANVDETDHLAELYNNAESYNVYLNGTELPYYTAQYDSRVFSDTEDATVASLLIQMMSENMAYAIYIDASTAPDSVEVSVKSKGGSSDGAIVDEAVVGTAVI